MSMPRRFRLARARTSDASRRRDLDTELTFHLEERIEELVAQGMPRAQAEREVRARFGDVAGVRAECEAIDATTDRRRSRREWVSALARQGRLAARALVRRPTFALVSIGTLALGCGAATAVFTLVNAVLLRPLPYEAPERLVKIGHSAFLSGTRMTIEQSDAAFLLYQKYATLFENMGVHRVADVNLLLPSAGTSVAERVPAAGVSASLFATLGVTPVQGRAFVEGEDRVGAPPVVVISEGMWRRKFGGDPAVVGKQVHVNGTPREIVGIMAGDFQYPSTSTQLWYPIAFNLAKAEPASFNYTNIGRLKPGVTIERASEELDRMLPRVVDEFPSEIPPAMFAQAQLHPVVSPLRDAMVGDVRQLLWILLGSAGLVLLISCANVASLFLVRAEEGQRELAVRRALGAGSAAAISQYLAEATLLATVGGLIGMALAAFAVRAVRVLPAGIDLPRLGEVGIDGSVVAFVVAVSAFCALAVCTLPLLRAGAISVASVLKDAGRSSTAGGRRQRARSVLVVAQVALALVLVAASGLMARSFARLRDVPPGFDSAQVLTMSLTLPASSYGDPTVIARFHARLLDELRTLPGVQEAALTSWLPLTEDHNNGAVEVEDHPVPANTIPPVHEKVNASDGYFGVMRTPLLLGRTFQPLDPTRAVREVIVSRAFATRYWKDQDPIGKRLRPGILGEWHTVIGVVGDVHLAALSKPAEEAIYMPLLWEEHGEAFAEQSVRIVLRTIGEPTGMIAPVRALVARLDPSLPVYGEQPLAAVLQAAAARTRFTMLLLGVASAVALTLGAVGIYGVMAYGVTLRQREIGVRMALGARPADVRRMISRHGVALAAAGVGIGLVVALGATRFLRGLLYDVSPTDPLTLVGTCAVLLVVALVASWLPARRASALPPIAALRGD